MEALIKRNRDFCKIKKLIPCKKMEVILLISHITNTNIYSNINKHIIKHNNFTNYTRDQDIYHENT